MSPMFDFDFGSSKCWNMHNSYYHNMKLCVQLSTRLTQPPKGSLATDEFRAERAMIRSFVKDRWDRGIDRKQFLQAVVKSLFRFEANYTLAPRTVVLTETWHGIVAHVCKWTPKALFRIRQLPITIALLITGAGSTFSTNQDITNNKYIFVRQAQGIKNSQSPSEFASVIWSKL